MTRDEARAILEAHNKWRRGDDTIPNDPPWALGRAIDVAVAELAKPAAVSRVEWSVIREFADRKKVNFDDLCAAVKESTEAYDRVQAELAAQQPAAPAVTPVDVEAVREVIAKMRRNNPASLWASDLARAIGETP